MVLASLAIAVLATVYPSRVRGGPHAGRGDPPRMTRDPRGPGTAEGLPRRRRQPDRGAVGRRPERRPGRVRGHRRAPAARGRARCSTCSAPWTRPSGGTVRLDGQSYDDQTADALAAVRNRKLGFVFQFHHLLREFTALENVMMPLLIAGEDERRGPLAGGGAAGRGGAGRADDAPAVAALGWRAAAGGGGPGAGGRPAGGPGRRALGQPRLRQQRAAAPAVRPAVAGVRDRAGGRDPQPVAGRPGRPGAVAGGRAPGAALRAWSRCPDVLRSVSRA